jgi:hypothetical protein
MAPAGIGRSNFGTSQETVHMNMKACYPPVIVAMENPIFLLKIFPLKPPFIFVIFKPTTWLNIGG